MAVAFYELLSHDGTHSNPFIASKLVFTGGSVGSGQGLTIVITGTNTNPLNTSFGSDITLAPGSSFTSQGAGHTDISVSDTYVGTGPGFTGPADGIHYGDTFGPSNLTFVNGFWGQNIDVVMTNAGTTELVDIQVQVSSSDNVLTTDGPPPAGPPSGIFPPDGAVVIWASTSPLVTYAHLSWNDNSNNETGFAIERSDDNGATWRQIAVTPANFTTFDDYGVSKGKPQYRVFSFNDTVRSIYSNIAALPFTISGVVPNSSLIGLNPNVIISGTGLGTSLFTQVSVVHFISRLNSSLRSDTSIISAIDGTHISTRVPNAPNGSEFVDVQIDNGVGNTNTLMAGYDYTIQFSWAIKNPSVPVAPGNKVTILSPGGPTGLDPTQIQTLTLNYVDKNGIPYTIVIPPTLWLIITLTEFTFILPDFSTGSPSTINLSITSTQFSGSVALGSLLTIFFKDAPGIYTLVTGKTDDTLYNIFEGGTVEVKIPDPFIKTGFIGG